MTQFLKAQFANMTQEQLLSALIATTIAGNELQEENEALKEENDKLQKDKNLAERIMKRIKDAMRSGEPYFDLE